MIQNFTPQSYPLMCRAGRGPFHLVIGWTAHGEPVAVVSAPSGNDATSRPEVIIEPVRYFLPGVSVCHDGPIEVITS